MTGDGTKAASDGDRSEVFRASHAYAGGELVDRRRVVVHDLAPEDSQRRPIKRVPHEHVDVSASVFADGHDEVRAVVQFGGPDGRLGSGADVGDGGEVVMAAHELPHDHHTATFRVDAEPGYASFRVVAWVDRFGTWVDGLDKKASAEDNPDRDEDVDLHLRVGAELAREFADAAGDDGDGDDLRTLRETVALLDPADDSEDGGLFERVGAGMSSTFAKAMRAHDPRRFATVTRPVAIDIIPTRGGHSSWYEMFPRSASIDPDRHGTFKDVQDRLPYVASMGFDILYLPPIHPIGHHERKGPNNATVAQDDDLGSPWAIGNADGGHMTVHPQLGTVDDLVDLVATARDRHGIDVALDIALQCAPDHPWVSEHPEWFTLRPDGTIKFAENPPKKYEDIVPLNFEGEDNRALWEACKGIFDFWIDKGVRTFRVDNPHTKAFRFWSWCIQALREEHGHDLVFLSEAFTRQNVAFELARGGFTQGYTYFAWKHAKWELEQYATELTRGEGVEFFKPNAWPNTPDILTAELQSGNRSRFLSRMFLASTLFANWGMYGPTYELLVNVAREPGSEEYLDSEKYQRRVWDLDASWSIRSHVSVVNRIRREHPALHNDRTLTFHHVDNDAMLAYSKRDRDSGDTILCVVSLDQQWTQSSMVNLDLGALGIHHDGHFQVLDELTGRSFTWQGSRNFVQLDPDLPAHVLHVQHG